MQQLSQAVLAELQALIADLGKGGGMMSPSVYDTAQVLRFCPPADARPVLEWLVRAQYTDGAWGDPLIPLARYVPTLAAVLALLPHTDEPAIDLVVAAGRAWLDDADDYSQPLPDGLPVGVELILPRLLADAAALGWSLPQERYAPLLALSRRRISMIEQVAPRRGSVLAHSWEGWGDEPTPALLDESGSIGHSPAATAAWIRAARGRDDLREACVAAQEYLAAAGALFEVPGVMPTAWPVPRFEQANALYALQVADVLDHPQLQAQIDAQIDDLRHALRANGLGFSDVFDPDGDDTAVALAVLNATGEGPGSAPIMHFAAGDHFCAYPGELQPSLSMVAHAIHALSVCGTSHPQSELYLIAQQGVDGRWLSDKWNGSWLYTTGHAIVALATSSHTVALQRAVDALGVYQYPDGGWGAQQVSAEETAYAVLALHALQRCNQLPPSAETTLHKAEQWLIRNYQPNALGQQVCWLAKEMYRPYRVARMIELAATLQSFNSIHHGMTDGGRPRWTAHTS